MEISNATATARAPAETISFYMFIISPSCTFDVVITLAPANTNRLPIAYCYWRARYIFIFAALSSIASPVTSTSAFFTVPVKVNGAL